MNPSNVMKELATWLAADTELQNWCKLELGKELTIQLGVDEDNPPVVEDYPICGITDVTEKRGLSQHMQVFHIALSCGLLNKETSSPVANLRMYDGLPQVADLKHHIEAACFRLRKGGVSVSGDSVPFSLYPLFVGYTSLEYHVPKSTRRAMR